MRRFVAAAATVVALSACGGSGIDHGYVTGKQFRASYTTFIIIEQTCGQNCWYPQTIPVTYPDRWTLFLRLCGGAAKAQHCETGEVDVSHGIYDKLRTGDYYGKSV